MRTRVWIVAGLVALGLPGVGALVAQNATATEASPCPDGTYTEQDVDFAVRHACAYAYTGVETSFVVPGGGVDQISIIATGALGGAGQNLCTGGFPQDDRAE